MLINKCNVGILVAGSAYYYHFRSLSGEVLPFVHARLGQDDPFDEMGLSSIPEEYDHSMAQHRLLLSATGELHCVLTFEERYKIWNEPHGPRAALRESRNVLSRDRRQLELAEPCTLVLEMARGHNSIELRIEGSRVFLDGQHGCPRDRRLSVLIESVLDRVCYGRVLDGPDPIPDTSHLQQVAVRPFHGLERGDVVTCREVGIGVRGDFLDPSSTIVAPVTPGD